MNSNTNKKLFKLNIYVYSAISLHFYSTNINSNTKHYPTANKEWKDSIYSYNKSYLKHLPVKGYTSNDILSSHFYLTNLKGKHLSKNMKTSIIYNSNKKIFTSKPRIKHSSDKTIISLYTYNREKEFLMRKLCFFEAKYDLFRKWVTSGILKKIKMKGKMVKKGSKKWHIINAIKRNKTRLFRLKARSWWRKRMFFPLYNIKYKNELDFIRYKTLDFYKKTTYFNNIFVFMFFRKLLYLLGIDIFMPLNIGKHNDLDKEYIKTVDDSLRQILNREPNKLMWLKKGSNQLGLINKSLVGENLIAELLSNQRYSYTDLILLNKHMFYYIESRFIKTDLITDSEIVNIYIKFKSKYYEILFLEFFSDRSHMLYLLRGLELNTLKFTKLLSNIRVLMARIYNKRIELNITNLKYPFLNSDIYTKIIVKKAAKVLNISRLLKSALDLSTIPNKIVRSKGNSMTVNNINGIDALSLDYNTSKHKLSYFVENLFNSRLINIRSVKDNHKSKGANKLFDILNTIKYKWVAGVWLQASGRITRRNTAARSAFKVRTKGSLRNERYYSDNNKIRPISTLVLRNTVKSNSQYTFIKSGRRIGSFGLKSWISSY